MVKRYRRVFKRRPRFARRYPSKARTSSKFLTQVKIHSFKRTFSQTITVTDTFQHFGTYTVLQGLPNYTEFTNLFDQYRVCAVRALFIFDQNSATVTPTGTPALPPSFIPNLFTVRDYDDGTALAALADYEQYETLKIKRLDKPVKVYYRPKPAANMYNGSWTGYGTPKGNPWMDCSSTGVQYYGLKFGIDGSTAGGVGNYNLGTVNIYYTVYLQCRGTR